MHLCVLPIWCAMSFRGKIDCVAGVVLSAFCLCVSASMRGGQPAYRDDYLSICV